MLFKRARVRLRWTDRIESILSEVGRSRSLLKEPGWVFSMDGGVTRAHVFEVKKSVQRSREIIGFIVTEC